MPEQIKRLRDRLVQPVGAPSRPAAAGQPPSPANTPAPRRSSAADQGEHNRKLTPAERSNRLHTTRINKAEAAGSPTALLTAWTDRIRAAKDPVLSRKAAAALADIYVRHTNSRE